MKKEDTKSVKNGSFKDKAEEQLRKYPTVMPHLTDSEIQKLFHQFEEALSGCEMQNEQLRAANDEIRAISEKFSWLYNFAPVGYFILDRDGTICDANILGARFFGSEYSNLIGKNFKLFISTREHDKFNDFLQKVFENNVKENCEVQLTGEENLSTFLRLDAILYSDASKCFVSAIDITDKRKAKEEVDSLVQQWSATFDSMKDAISLIDTKGHILKCNKSMCDLLKRANEKIIGHYCWELVHNTYGPIENCPLTRMHSSLKKEFLSLQLGEQYLDVTADPIFDEGKNLVGAVHIISDVTEQRRIYRILKEKEEKYRLLFESSADAIMTLNPPKWLFTSCNSATIKMFMVRDEAEFVSKTPYELSPEYQPDGKLSSEKALEMINMAMQNSSHFFEWTHKRADGEEFFATVLLTKVVLGNEEFLQATVRDITESKKMQEEINIVEKRFMNVLHASKDAILLIDENTFVECNQATTEMLGYKSKEEFLMTHPSKLSPKFQSDGRASVEKADDMMKIALEKGYNRFEWMHTKANGEDFPVEVSLTPISYKGKTVIHCLWRDITAVKKAEKELSKKIHDLEVFNKAAVERELKMIELKKRIRELEGG